MHMKHLHPGTSMRPMLLIFKTLQTSLCEAHPALPRGPKPCADHLQHIAPPGAGCAPESSRPASTSPVHCCRLCCPQVPEAMSRAWKPANLEGLPEVFTGGFVGYAGYDTVRYVYSGVDPGLGPWVQCSGQGRRRGTGEVAEAMRRCHIRGVCPR